VQDAQWLGRGRHEFGIPEAGQSWGAVTQWTCRRQLKACRFN
jgi:hypothetical protein